MPDFIKRQNLALILLLIVCVIILIFSDFAEGPRAKVYDCRDAHWHPDIPIEVKKQCQELLGKKRLTVSLNNVIIV
jgi:hypothetical protein